MERMLRLHTFLGLVVLVTLLHILLSLSQNCRAHIMINQDIRVGSSRARKSAHTRNHFNKESFLKGAPCLTLSTRSSVFRWVFQGECELSEAKADEGTMMVASVSESTDSMCLLQVQWKRIRASQQVEHKCQKDRKLSLFEGRCAESGQVERSGAYRRNGS